MIDTPQIELEKLYVDHQGNKLIPFERLPSGRYYCCIIEPAIRLIPIVQNSDHCFREARELTRELSFDEALAMATSALEATIKEVDSVRSPEYTKEYFRCKLALREREVFAVMFLSNTHTLICYEELFLGTINQCNVYPREVVKVALRVNASAVVLGHNHPSGSLVPSRNDEQITRRLVEALDLLDVRVLDHIIVSKDGTCSMAEKGMFPTAAR